MKLVHIWWEPNEEGYTIKGEEVEEKEEFSSISFYPHFSSSTFRVLKYFSPSERRPNPVQDRPLEEIVGNRLEWAFILIPAQILACNLDPIHLYPSVRLIISKEGPALPLSNS